MPGAVNKPETNEKGHRQLLSMSLSLMNRFSSHWRVPAFLRLLRLFGELSPDRWRLLRRTSFLFFLSVSYQSESILSIYNRIIFILSEIVHIAYIISDIFKSCSVFLIHQVRRDSSFILLCCPYALFIQNAPSGVRKGAGYWIVVPATPLSAASAFSGEVMIAFLPVF